MFVEAVERGCNLLAMLLPELAASVLAHLRLIGILGTEDVRSTTNVTIASTVFLSMAHMRTPWEASEALRPASLVSRNGIAVLSLTFTQAAHAYIGPGLGAGAIAIALGGVGFFLFVLFTALWYPFKRLLRRWRAKTTAAFRQDGEPHADTGAEDDARH